MWHKYFVYVDDGDYAHKIAVPAASEEQARQYCAGNGTIVGVKDATDDFPISLEAVFTALEEGGFCRWEVEFMARALEQLGIAADI